MLLMSLAAEAYPAVFPFLHRSFLRYLDVINSLKEEGSIESRNIVIFTASSNRKMLDEIKNSGIKEILKNPYSLNDLVAMIEKYRPNT